ncbi:thiamine pyrophosphate-binding protein [Blautia schinkii]|nr:thiamine pyrophosphate-binding protein [Blautia schinkii]
MKVSDYIVEYLIEKGITDVFGYPGGMVTHLMESFSKYSEQISAHLTYHEQGAAFAACGYAQASGKPGVAYATSGPGATNLITGICDAFFDSIPTVFITGQVNTFESRGQYIVRQRGFQETDIVSMVAPVTKYAQYVESADKIKYYLDYAFAEAISGRMGPVLLDIPMNVFRAEIDSDMLQGTILQNRFVSREKVNKAAEMLKTALDNAEHPCCLIGNGVKITNTQQAVKDFCHKFHIPMVTSMIAFDAVSEDSQNYGFVGAYGDRAANFVVAKSDLVITIGSRLDVRQVGAKRENFAPDSQIVRFDVDEGELEYRVHENEISIQANMQETCQVLKHIEDYCDYDYSTWVQICDVIKKELSVVDKRTTAELVKRVSHNFPENAVVTTDVGQNQVWVAQSAELKKGQKVLFSGGHGAMGYSLPAAIGAYYASGKPVVCVTGDGGLQMNIQELQFIKREKIPVKIVVLNNDALGMIRHFQEMYFEGNYYQTKPSGGYSAPDFRRVAEAYGIRSVRYDMNSLPDMASGFADDLPLLVEVMINEDTYVFPKLEFGKPNQDQEPLLNRELYDRLMQLGDTEMKKKKFLGGGQNK